MPNYFNSNKITVYPTAYRQYVNGSGDTIQVNPEARVTTEYNTTHLVEGLLDKSINDGNFVIGYSNNIIQFCMSGYYFNLDLSGLNLTTLYVKTKIVKTVTSNPDWKYMYELVPITYDSNNSNRDLDNGTYFIGLEYVTTATAGYFPLLINGEIPETSKLKFSIDSIGQWYNGYLAPISSILRTGDLYSSYIFTTKINGLILRHIDGGLRIVDDYTGKTLTVTANLTNSGIFTNSASFTNSNTFSNTASFTNSSSFTNSGSFTNNATTTINKDLTIGANSTYTGTIGIKSKKNLSIVGNNTSNSTLTFEGTSTFQSGDYDSNNATEGSEYIKVGGNRFNIVTRDTNQTISGKKTFSSAVKITNTGQSTSDSALEVYGSINACVYDSYLRLLLGNYDTNMFGLRYQTLDDTYPLSMGFDNNSKTIVLRSKDTTAKLYSIKADATTTQNGNFRVDGSISSTSRSFFAGMSLSDNYVKLNNKKLTLENELTINDYAPNLHTGGKVILSTKCGNNFQIVGQGEIKFYDAGGYEFAGGNYNADNTTGSESVTVASKTFNILTRNTAQEITANKILSSGCELLLGGVGSNYKISSTGNIICNSFIVKNGSTTKATINSSGDVYANQFYGNYYTSSDRRLKENIVPFENKNSILDLPIYKFDYINGKKNNIGCIAQDLQQLYPELVSQNENGYLNIAENKLVYLLIDEVKKLKDEINQLKNSK